MQPVSGSPARPPGEGLTPHQTGIASQPLSGQQRTVLESLVTRIIALTQQQSTEVWAGLRHDLKLSNEQSLLSGNFPAAQQNLNQRLVQAQNNFSSRQDLQQLTVLLQQGNNRQAVSDYIRQQFGYSVLSQLSPQQLKDVLNLLQNGQLAIPQPQQRPVSDRPLLPAEQSTLNQLAGKLAAATGEKPGLIWQTLQELADVKAGEPLPARHFTLLTTWLQASLTLSDHPAPTLHILQSALKQPMDSYEWQTTCDYAQQQFQATATTILSPLQVQDLLYQLLLRRSRAVSSLIPEAVQPIYSPIVVAFSESIKSMNARPWLVIVVVIVVVVLLGLVF